jgi:superfamily II DNA helicase RecQ
LYRGRVMVSLEDRAQAVVGRSGEENFQQRSLLREAIVGELRAAVDEATQEMRAALEKIAARRPVMDEAGTSFYRSRQDAKDVLRKLKESSRPSEGLHVRVETPAVKRGR